jgi:hypothetical protein
MVNLKTFEYYSYESSYNGDPAPSDGDYVVLRNKYFDGLIGKIVEFDEDLQLYKISYISILHNNPIYCRFSISDLKYWAKDKQELEALIASENYNI